MDCPILRSNLPTCVSGLGFRYNNNDDDGDDDDDDDDDDDNLGSRV